MYRVLNLQIFLLFLYIFNLNATNLALPCSGCHGPNGLSSGDSIPSINNLDKEYFIKSFNDYKTGVRDHYIMKIIANGYTKNQIELLADYYDKKE